jgi:hypothetical protein
LRRRSTIVALAFTAICGCGDQRDDRPTKQHRSAQADAARVADTFLYSQATPAKICAELWLPSSRTICARETRMLRRGLASDRFVLPPRGTLKHRLAGVHGASISIEVGERQPVPGTAPPFYGTFELTMYRRAWRIVRIN